MNNESKSSTGFVVIGVIVGLLLWRIFDEFITAAGASSNPNRSSTLLLAPVTAAGVFVVDDDVVVVVVTKSPNSFSFSSTFPVDGGFATLVIIHKNRF